ncbi:hypothetical protein [Levilactobacillus paucivorans]|uniref:hypothetical protein n=1 Tax=Levilactobacillus paucivorans TaxID=616990 RepID=UPI00070962B3|nr:hypothetical protein [Levilactobacillus paucivorans]
MKSKLIISALAVVSGLARMTVPSVNAQAKTYKTTPKKLQDSWHYHDKEFQYKLKITEFTLDQTVYQHGKINTKISTKKRPAATRNCTSNATNATLVIGV